MVNFVLTGFIVSDLSFSTTGSGAKRATFIVECPEENSLPLHFDITCFGSRASEAEALVPGMKLLIAGRMTAWKAYQDGQIEKPEEAPQISETELQILSDDAVAELYGGVVRERATEERRFRDLLRGQ